MIEFAVHIPGHHEVIEPSPEEREGGAEDQKPGSWVLAVNQDSVLIAHEDGTLVWHPLDKCEFLQMRDPVGPTVVVAPEPLPVYAVTKGPEIVLPPNRMQRRHPA